MGGFQINWNTETASLTQNKLDSTLAFWKLLGTYEIHKFMQERGGSFTWQIQALAAWKQSVAVQRLSFPLSLPFWTQLSLFPSLPPSPSKDYPHPDSHEDKQLILLCSKHLPKSNVLKQWRIIFINTNGQPHYKSFQSLVFLLRSIVVSYTLASGTVFHSVCLVWLSSGPPEVVTFIYYALLWNWFIVTQGCH